MKLYAIVDILVKILMVFISFLVGLSLFNLRKRKEDEVLANSKETLLASEKKLHTKSSMRLSEFLQAKYQYQYHKLQIYLSKYGVNYMMKRVVDPAEFIIVNIIISIVFFIVGTSMYGFIVGILFGVLGVFCLPLLLNISNDRDNDMIIDDIRALYETLKLRTESGIFFTSSMMQCYRVVKNDRLKSALLTLTSELDTTNDVKTALSAFQLKFKNRYIDQLCVVIRQGYESGATVNSMNTIIRNLSSMQAAAEISKKNKLDNEIMYTQLLILCAILVTILFVLFSFMGSSINF